MEETKTETLEETKEEQTTKAKFNDNVVEKNTIDMKIYNVPKQYALQFKKFADMNGMRFNSAMILMLEKLNTMEKLEALETVIFENRNLINKIQQHLIGAETETEVSEEAKPGRRTYGDAKVNG